MQFWSALIEAGVATRAETPAMAARIRFLRMPSAFDRNAQSTVAIASCFAMAMFPNLLVRASDEGGGGGGMVTLGTGAAAAVHPASINRRSDLEAAKYVAYAHLIQSKRLYAQETSAVPHVLSLLVRRDLSSSSMLTPRQVFSGDVDIKVCMSRSPDTLKFAPRSQPCPS